VSKKTTIDAEVIKKAEDYGYANMHFIHLDSPDSRLIRSDDLMLMFQRSAQDALNALKALPEKREWIESTIADITLKIDHKFPTQQEQKLRSFFFIRLYSKLKVYQKLQSKLEKDKQEYYDQIDDFAFISAMEEQRRHDDQVRKATQEDAADLLIKLAAISGAKDAQAGITRKKDEPKSKSKLKPKTIKEDTV
jgi:hypothetical protein